MKCDITYKLEQYEKNIINNNNNNRRIRQQLFANSLSLK